MNRFIALALSLVTLSGGVFFTWTHLAELPPDNPWCQAGFCPAGPPTVQSEPSNPFPWLDLAERKAAEGNTSEARSLFAKAASLGPNIPPVLVRIVNFDFANGTLSGSIPNINRILRLTSAYDGILFRYLVRSDLPMSDLIAKAIPDPGPPAGDPDPAQLRPDSSHASAPAGSDRLEPEAARAWLAYVIAERHPDARMVWDWLRARKVLTTDLRSRWVEYLIAQRKEYPQAIAAWAAEYPEPGYPDQNRIFNSNFAKPLNAGRLGWTLSPHAQVTVEVRDGLDLVFNGKENTAYANLTQGTFLPAGPWLFSAEIEASEISTDQGPFFRINDAADPRRLEVSTEPIRGSRPRGTVQLSFASPPGGSFVQITLQRRQSEKFDNKIQGRLHIYSIRLSPKGRN